MGAQTRPLVGWIMEAILFDGHGLDGDDEVAFVFARGGVQDCDEVAAFFKREKGQSVGSLFVFAGHSWCLLEASRHLERSSLLRLCVCEAHMTR